MVSPLSSFGENEGKNEAWNENEQDKGKKGKQKKGDWIVDI